MVKRICDICRKNEADKHYKIKERHEICEFTEHGVFAKSSWVDIDICESCLCGLIIGRGRSDATEN